MPDTIHQIPLSQIDATALPRDRTALDDDSLTELRLSIATHGLRLPVEVFELAEPDGPIRYGLLSGFRRYAAFRALLDLTGQDRYASIPALIRAPGDLATALTAMVEENEVRADLSPWERGRTAVTARDHGIFPTIEEAVEKLYPSATRHKHARIRSLARLVEELEGHLTEPETLSQRQCRRLSSALHRGFGDLMRAALAEPGLSDGESQWTTLHPILAEAENPEADAPPPSRAGRPRRMAHPRPGLTVRRERTRQGYLLRFTGREATGPLIDTVLDELERMFAPT